MAGEPLCDVSRRAELEEVTVSANAPLRLVAIDPGLAHLGIAITNVTAMHQVEIDRTWTVNTSPKLSFLDRLDLVLTDVLAAVEATEEGFSSWYAVIEDPRGVIQSDAAGRRKDPRRIADLVAAFGAIVADVMAGGRVTAVELVPVVRWYPRAGRGLMKHADVLQRIRARYLDLAASEHVCMAVGLADWWSVQIAPQLWFERRKYRAWHEEPSRTAPRPAGLPACRPHRRLFGLLPRPDRRDGRAAECP